MSLLFFSYMNHPEYWLVFAGNRDEFYDRPTKSLSLWNNGADILAGRDLKANGTWLGITKTGKFAAITNYRDPANDLLSYEDVPSRGNLVSEFLSGKKSAKKYLEYIETMGYRYKGFNLVLGDRDGFYYFSNRKEGIQLIKPGLYGLSNHLLNTPWPKVKKGLARFKELHKHKNEINTEDLFTMLKDRTRPPDVELPDTGVGLDRERLLSSMFIHSNNYGTRSSSVILFKTNGQVTFIERTYNYNRERIAGHKDIRNENFIS